MKTFLQIVAQDIIRKYGNDLSRIAIIFPNKRASLFLNEELYRCAGKPVWAPNYLTISELFRKYSKAEVGDPIKLVCDLYKSFVKITGKDETLDHFYDWGRMLISDFDDIDKNMADADKLFATLLVRLVYRSTTRISMMQLGGSLLAFAGMVIVVLNGRFVLHLSPLGDALAFTACLSWSVYSLLMKWVSAKYGAAFITRKVFFYGVLTILPYYIFYPTLPTAAVLTKPVVVGNLAFLGCLASMICFLTWNWCISKLGAVKATNWVYFNPITTMIFASWVLGEKITPYFLAGATCILLGMFVADRSTKTNN